MGLERHIAPHALFRLLPSWQKELDELGFVGTTLTGLSNSYDRIPHEILIAKLEAYSLHKNCINLLPDYFSGRKQTKKIGSPVSECWKIICGIPQGLSFISSQLLDG